MLFIWIFINVLIICFTPRNALVIYKTETNDNVEYYDCILEDDIPYCRRPGFPIHIQPRMMQTDAIIMGNYGLSKTYVIQIDH